MGLKGGGGGLSPTYSLGLKPTFCSDTNCQAQTYPNSLHTTLQIPPSTPPPTLSLSFRLLCNKHTKNSNLNNSICDIMMKYIRPPALVWADTHEHISAKKIDKRFCNHSMKWINVGICLVHNCVMFESDSSAHVVIWHREYAYIDEKWLIEWAGHTELGRRLEGNNWTYMNFKQFVFTPDS